MASAVGRELLLKKGGTVIAGLRNVTISWGGESINVTSGEDSGQRLLLAASGEEQIDLSFDGLTKDSVLRDIALGSSSKMLTDVTIEWPIFDSVTNSDPADISGNFRFSSYEEGAPYQDAITFSGTLESSGAWTYDPESVS